MARYFTLDEFRCRCCGALPPAGMSDVLVERLDKLREMYGYPIHVSSGYRCPKHNAEVGGVWNSRHMVGDASDIWVDGDYEEFYQLVRDSNLFDAVGHYESEFVHVDTQDNGEEPNAHLWWE